MDIKRLAIVPCLMMSLAVAAPIPAQAVDGPQASETFAEANPSPCPEMTDSVYRLYSAFFGREPDSQGWAYWMSIYQQGDANLETISASFVDSKEFVQTYGSLDNRAFVELVYNNVLGRIPDQAGWDHWTNALNNGYGRGAVMIAFSESEEYTNRTDTWAPLAGYLQWYGRPMTFSCGTGNVNIPVNGARYSDVVVWNESAGVVNFAVTIQTPQGSIGGLTDDLAKDFYHINWNMALHEVAATSIDVNTFGNDEIYWTVVFYEHPHASDRSPYTDEGGLANLLAQNIQSESVQSENVQTVEQWSMAGLPQSGAGR